MQGQELDMMILMIPIQLSMFYDLVFLQPVRAGLASRAWVGAAQLGG